MEQHSQLSKAAALRRLAGRLLRLGMQGSNQDTDSGLLLLLFSLAGVHACVV